MHGITDKIKDKVEPRILVTYELWPMNFISSYTNAIYNIFFQLRKSELKRRLQSRLNIYLVPYLTTG